MAVPASRRILVGYVAICYNVLATIKLKNGSYGTPCLGARAYCVACFFAAAYFLTTNGNAISDYCRRLTPTNVVISGHVATPTIRHTCMAVGSFMGIARSKVINVKNYAISLTKKMAFFGAGDAISISSRRMGLVSVTLRGIGSSIPSHGFPNLIC